MTFDEVVAAFRKHLYLPDIGPLAAVLGATVANQLPGDPVWLLLVGPPASGKTEILSSLRELSFVHEVSTFTQAGLLSGSTSRREGAAGGLLAELGKFGIIVCKDFTSVLSESSETRSGLLAALREIYDGRWVRRLGTDGGRKLGWVGKAGLLAGVTETLDRHTDAIGAMGERFVLYRMPRLDDEGRLTQGRVSLRNVGRQEAMRADLLAVVQQFVAEICIPKEPLSLDEVERERLVHLTDLATRCRSAVERSSRDREVELVPQPEALGRLQAVLAQLLHGFRTIGMEAGASWHLIEKIALDGMPKPRRVLVELLAPLSPGVFFTSAQAGDAVGLPSSATARALEDLAAHGLVQRHTDSSGPHRWVASTWLKERWAFLNLGLDLDVNVQV